MITHDQADQAADSILDRAKTELRARQEKRADLASAEQRRRNSPLIPAFTAAVTVIVALDYVGNPIACAALGATIGGLFGWAARKG